MDLSSVLPCNKQINCVRDSKQLSPSVKLKMHSQGWVREINTPNATERQYFMCDEQGDTSHFVTDVLGEDNFTSILDVSAHLSQHAWVENCVAIGGAAQRVDSFVIDRLHLVFGAVLRLLALFPTHHISPALAREYNRLTRLESEHIIDLHALHYHLASQCNSEFWGRVGKKPLSEKCMRKIFLFRQSGTVPVYEGESLSPALWASCLFGMGVIPESYDPLVDQCEANWISEQMQKMKSMIASAAHTMPNHADYLQRIYSSHG